MLTLLFSGTASSLATAFGFLFILSEYMGVSKKILANGLLDFLVKKIKALFSKDTPTPAQ